MRFWYSLLLFLLVTAPLLAQEKKQIEDTAPKQSVFRAFWQDFFSDWTGWLITGSLVALIALVGALMYVRMKQSEDD
jgi:hypothetical protein